MIKKAIITILLTLNFSANAYNNQIKQIESLRTIEDIITNEHSNDVLVIFDIDDVLIAGDDVLLRNETNKARLFGYLAENLDKCGIFDTSGFIWSSYKSHVIEDKITQNLFKHLGARGIDKIALTSSCGGLMGKVKRFEDHKAKVLRRLSLEFSLVQYNANIDKDKFHNVCGRYPVFKHGIIFSCFHKKSLALEYILDKVKLDMNKQYKKIIFIDNESRHLIDIAEFAGKSGYDYLGLLYSSAENDGEIEPDLASEKMQMEYLIQNKVWLSDEKIKNKLQ